MLIPSTWTILAGSMLVAAVAAFDWFVWGLNLAVSPRSPRKPVPLTGLELVDLGLRQLVAINRAVLPRAVFGTVRANSVPVLTNPDDGFKRVA